MAQLRRALEWTRSGVHALVGAKHGVEHDLHELQESVKRSSSLLIERAQQQQQDVAATKAEAADLMLRLHDAQVRDPVGPGKVLNANGLETMTLTPKVESMRP